MSRPNKNDGGGQTSVAEAEIEPLDAANSSNKNKTKTTVSQKIKHHVMQNLILFLTILGIVGGVTVGILGRIYKPSPTVLILISFPGEMLLRVLKMLILPLIISSLITGLAQLDPKSSGKMGTRALAFYVLTTFIATVTGICCALIIRPGRQKLNRAPSVKSAAQQLTTMDALLDIIRNMFPENVVQACSQQIGTVYKTINVTREIATSRLLENGTNITLNIITTEPKIIRELKYSDGSNVMGLVVFCILFGIFISHSKSEAQILYDFFFVMNELIMKIVAFIMWYSPFGILCLVAGNIIKIENMADTAKRLSIYMITVIIGLTIHSMITVQTLYFLATRKNPFKFLKGMLQAWLTAIGTASSSATLPITFRCLEENNKVDKRVTRFMLPLGATINMDGTALYQCVATIFIAQLNGINLTLGQLIAISLASTATSIGVASIPSAALVTMLIVLGTVGLPTEDISYIVTVDWLLDRLRTSINVLGDAYGCGIVEHLSREELKKLDQEAEKEFAQIIAHQSIGRSGSGGSGNPPNLHHHNHHHHAHAPAQHRNSHLPADESNMNLAGRSAGSDDFGGNYQHNKSRSISIADERKLSTAAEQFNEFKAQQPPSIEIHQPSIPVMDAIERRARTLLYESAVGASVFAA